MTLRANGSYIGPRASAVSVTAASGVWDLRTAQRYQAEAAWPVPFAPDVISGLQLWLDAADASTLYDATTGGSLVAADGTVKRWEDKSGNDRHATEATNGPQRKTAVQGGLDVLRFDGSNDHLNVNEMASVLQGNDNEFTLFVLAKNTGSGTGKVVFAAASSSSQQPLINLYLGNDQLVYFRRDSSQNSGFTNASTRPSDFASIAAVQQTTIHTLHLNGSSVQTANVDLDMPSLDRAAVGCLSRDVKEGFFEGDIAEIIIYDSALSDTDREAVESYLLGKWAIT